MTTLEKTQPSKTFYCVSGQTNRPIEQLGRIAPRSHSKRCITCREKADAQSARLAAISSKKGDFSAFKDEMKRIELGRL